MNLPHCKCLRAAWDGWHMGHTSWREMAKVVSQSLGSPSSHTHFLPILALHSRGAGPCLLCLLASVSAGLANRRQEEGRTQSVGLANGRPEGRSQSISYRLPPPQVALPAVTGSPSWLQPSAGSLLCTTLTLTLATPVYQV